MDKERVPEEPRVRRRIAPRDEAIGAGGALQIKVRDRLFARL
jgi:hypothetical protein